MNFHRGRHVIDTCDECELPSESCCCDLSLAASEQSTVHKPQPRNLREQLLTRRVFCNSIALTSAGLAVASTCFTSTAEAQQNPTLAYPPQRIEGAESLLPGSSLYFTYPTRNDPAILVRAQDGQVYAYSQMCTHRGCSIYFDPAKRCLECPCHKGAYELQTGSMMYGPPPRPLDQIALQMRAGGQVWAVGKRSGSTEFTA